MKAKTKKVLKFLLLALVGSVLFYRPIKPMYKNKEGGMGNGANLRKKGLFNVIDITDPKVEGKIGFLGMRITWPNGSVWTAV